MRFTISHIESKSSKYSIKGQTLRGLYWTTGTRAIEILLQIGFTAILARLLSPKDFGLIGMALVFTRFANMAKGLGLGGAVIQRLYCTHEELSSIFWLNVIVSLFFSIAVAIISPLGAAFYHQPVLTSVIVVLAANVFLSSLNSVHNSLMRKTLRFKTLALIEISVLILSYSGAVITAYFGWEIWSLVTRIILSTFFLVIFTWYFSNWLPGWHFNFGETISYLSYGGYLSLTNIFYFFTQNIDFILVGKYIGPETLGIYTIAFNLTVMPGEQVKNTITKVLFPSISKIQENKYKLTEVFNQSIKYITLFLVPMLFILAILSKEVIIVLYGDKWLQAASILPIFTLLGIVRGLNYIIRTVILSKGNSRLIFCIETIQSLVMSSAIFLAVLSTNLFLIAITYTLISLIFFLIGNYYLERYIYTSFTNLFHNLSAGLISGILMLFSLFILKILFSLFFTYNNYVFKLIFFSLSGVIIYFGLLWYLFRNTLLSLKKLILSR